MQKYRKFQDFRLED